MKVVSIIRKSEYSVCSELTILVLPSEILPVLACVTCSEATIIRNFVRLFARASVRVVIMRGNNTIVALLFCEPYNIKINNYYETIFTKNMAHCRVPAMRSGDDVG